jgi:hypothetical protein
VARAVFGRWQAALLLLTVNSSSHSKALPSMIPCPLAGCVGSLARAAVVSQSRPWAERVVARRVRLPV